MEIVERATASIDSADLEEIIAEVIKAKGYRITSGLANSALTGITLELELIRVTTPKKWNRGGAGEQPGQQLQKTAKGGGGPG